jgi:hypothetical protein
MAAIQADQNAWEQGNGILADIFSCRRVEIDLSLKLCLIGRTALRASHSSSPGVRRDLILIHLVARITTTIGGREEMMLLLQMSSSLPSSEEKCKFDPGVLRESRGSDEASCVSCGQNPERLPQDTL